MFQLGVAHQVTFKRVAANVRTGHTAESDLDATESIDLSWYREPKHCSQKGASMSID